jgi:hypothetical protein
LAYVYVSGDALDILTSSDLSDLNDAELVNLALTRSLMSSSRPKFKPEIYRSLIDKKLLSGNKGLTENGRNILEKSDIIKRIRDIGNRQDQSKFLNQYIQEDKDFGRWVSTLQFFR